MNAPQDLSLEGSFYQYMHHTGQVDSAANRRVLEFYVPHFATCRKVLDIGCGEGQFIEALAERGVDAVGIDLDSHMAESCTARGLPVQQADLFAYLPEHPAEFDGIFCSNVVEHLAVPDVLRFLEMASTALSPGGVLLVATPNPESLIVQLCEFWRDATHVRLYSRSLLEFLLTFTGMQQVQSGQNPAAVWQPPDDLQAIPGLLEQLPLWHASLPRASSPATNGQMDNRPLWRRTVSSWRRSLGSWMARTLLYDEMVQLKEESATAGQRISSLESTLDTWRTTARQVGSALYRSDGQFRANSREIFALGIKPSAPEGGR
jgi:SAM-dependent methyltransferase